jgi:Fic-DOC domain mobile mystery protein B
MEWLPIEGETPVDPSELKPKLKKVVTNRQQLNVVEADNIRRHMAKYLLERPSARKAPFTYAWCVRVHHEMFGRVWQWAGQVRNRDGQSLGVTCHTIVDEFARLLDDLVSWTSYDMELVEQAARLHRRAVFIHPFPNGNGRWSRLMANIWLRRHDAPLVHWPAPEMGEVSPVRSEYIDALRLANHSSDYSALVALHKRFQKRPTSDQAGVAAI